MAAAVALITSFYPESLSALRAESRRWLGLDAAAALLAAAGLVFFVQQMRVLLMDRFHAQALFSMGTPNLIVNTAPALAAIAGAVQSTVVSAAFLGLVVLILRRLPRSWMVWPAGAIALFVQLPLDIRTPGEFALQYGLALATAAASVAFCIWFGRTNYLAYALVFWALALRGPLAELFGTPIASLQVQGWIVAAALAATVIWAVAPALGRKTEA